MYDIIQGIYCWNNISAHLLLDCYNRETVSSGSSAISLFSLVSNYSPSLNEPITKIISNIDRVSLWSAKVYGCVTVCWFQ